MEWYQYARTHGFFGSKLSIEKYWPLLYTWAYKFMASQAVQKSLLDSEAMSTEMMVDWYNYCQKNYESSCGA